MIITSFSNQKVKTIRKLEQKKYRQETGLFFIEGLHTVGEAVQTGAPIEALVTAPALLESKFGQSLLEHPTLKDIDQIQVSTEIYQKIAHKDGPQGIGAIIHQDWGALAKTTSHTEDIWVALDAISDPGNLGTIMRTAEAVGCRGVILLEHATDPYDPTAVKASMGAIFSLQLFQADWHDFKAWQVNNNLLMVGTSDSAQTDYQAIDYSRPLVLLMGSERHGLSTEMQEACDQMVFIPMAGRGDSLNLAVATGIMLYEIYNQIRNLDIINL
jgi:RNA methyltransferase, TrmH family